MHKWRESSCIREDCSALRAGRPQVFMPLHVRLMSRERGQVDGKTAQALYLPKFQALGRELPCFQHEGASGGPLYQGKKRRQLGSSLLWLQFCTGGSGQIDDLGAIRAGQCRRKQREALSPLVGRRVANLGFS
jgi:hypothetical protein